jgi:hypothetical protein
MIRDCLLVGSVVITLTSSLLLSVVTIAMAAVGRKLSTECSADTSTDTLSRNIIITEILEMTAESAWITIRTAHRPQHGYCQSAPKGTR